MTSQPARLTRDAAPLPGRPGGFPNAVAKLRAAALEFFRAWGRVRHQERNKDLRVLESILTLVFCAGMVGIGVTYDAETVRWANRLSPDTIWIFEKITHLGASGYIFALTVCVTVGAILARGGGRGRKFDAAMGVLASRAFYLFAVAAVSGLVSQALKHLFGRARPKLMEIVGPLHFDPFSLNATFASFPSGHAVTAFAMAIAIGSMAPRWRWPLLGVAVLVGVSRVVIGAHYVSDVIAGAGLGYASAALARRAFAARGIVFRRARAKVRARNGRIMRQITRAFV